MSILSTTASASRYARWAFKASPPAGERFGEGFSRDVASQHRERLEEGFNTYEVKDF